MKPLTIALALMIFVLTTRADDKRSVPPPQTLIAADVLKALAIEDAALEHVDEPPGKLQMLRSSTTLRDTNVKVNVQIDLVYTPALFSETRSWDAKAIRAAAVRK